MADDELKTILRELDRARNAHQRTLAEVNEALRFCEDLPTGHPDGCHALRQANAKQRRALARYREALSAFNDHCKKKVKNDVDCAEVDGTS